MTHDLWLVLGLLVTAVILAVRNHSLGENEPLVWDVPSPSGERDD